MSPSLLDLPDIRKTCLRRWGTLDDCKGPQTFAQDLGRQTGNLFLEPMKDWKAFTTHLLATLVLVFVQYLHYYE